MTYACTMIGDKLHAMQQQAALADAKADGRVRVEGWTICSQWAEGKLVRGRPECEECRKACEVHERRVDTGVARALPLMGSARARELAEDGATLGEVLDAIVPGTTDVIEQLHRDVVIVPPEVAKALQGTPNPTEAQIVDAIIATAPARAARHARNSDENDDLIERVIMENPAEPWWKLTLKVRALGGKASKGSILKVRERIGSREPEKAPRAARASKANGCEHGDHPAPEGQRFCSPECQECESGGKPCSPECEAELGVTP